jgi:predicted ATP-grasp superfamily ATP-dependent carboligase
MTGPVEFSRRPDLERPTLVVSWTADAAGLGETVTGYLNRKLENRPFCHIDGVDFFAMDGVAIESDIIQFTEAAFYAGARKDIVVFRSSPPRYDWDRFLNLVLDVAQRDCGVAELYAIGGMVSLVPHVAPREMLANFSTLEMKETLSSQNMSMTWNYETPPGQRPTLNSYLLWEAKRRNLPAATLWVPVPFYLSSTGDPKAQLRVLEFFNRRLDLCMGFDDLDEAVRRQNRAIARARQESPEIDGFITRIEAGETLSPEGSQRLVSYIEKALAAPHA